MAIEPNSEDYFIDKDEDVATQMLCQKHPHGIPVLFKIHETGACGINWQDKGFEKIADLEQGVKTIREALGDSILRRTI